jgi:hypothetical protein
MKLMIVIGNFLIENIQKYAILLCILYLVIKLLLLVQCFILPFIFKDKFYYQYSVQLISLFTIINLYVNCNFTEKFLYLQIIFLLFLKGSQTFALILRGIVLSLVLAVYYLELLPQKYNLEYLSYIDINLENNLYVLLVIFGKDLIVELLLLPLPKIILYIIPFGGIINDLVYPPLSRVGVSCVISQSGVIVKQLDILKRGFDFPTQDIFKKIGPFMLQKDLQAVDRVGLTSVDSALIKNRYLYKDLHENIVAFHQQKVSKELYRFSRTIFAEELPLIESTKGGLYNETTATVKIRGITFPKDVIFPLFLTSINPEYYMYSADNFQIVKQYDYANMNFRGFPLTSSRLLALNVGTASRWCSLNGDSVNWEFLTKYQTDKCKNPGDCVLRHKLTGKIKIGEIKNYLLLSEDNLTDKLEDAEMQCGKYTNEAESVLICINNLSGINDNEVIEKVIKKNICKYEIKNIK